MEQYIGYVIAAATLAWLALQWTRVRKPFTISFPLDIEQQVKAVKKPQYKIEGPVLVTGGAGFLGGNIVEALVECGVPVVVFDFNRQYRAPAGVKFVQGDLTKASQIGAAIQENNIKTIFHVASPDPNSPLLSLLHDVNVTGTGLLIAAAKEHGVKTLVFTSSASVVFGGEDQVNVDESVALPAQFRDYYSETKAEAERMVMKAGQDGSGLVTISIRPHAIFGPKDLVMVPTTVKLAKAGRTRFIVGDGSNVVDWTYVGNVVHAHLLAAEVAQREGKKCAASGKTYFITNDEPVPFWVFMNWIFLGLGYDASTRWLPYKFILTLARIAQFIGGVLSKFFGKKVEMTLSPPRVVISGTSHWYNIAAAKRDLGYKPLWNMQQSLYLTLKHFSYLRNVDPSPATLKVAREGNLIELRMLQDAKAMKGRLGSEYREGLDKTMRGANQAIDESNLPFYTIEEVARHNKREDFWVIITDRTCGVDKVYDLTRYVEPHPGGVEAILQHKGADATEGFYGLQHPEHVHETLRKFVIGKLKKE